MYNIDLNVIIQALPQLFKGIEITLFISIISSVAAFCVGVVLVYLRTMTDGVLKFSGAVYVEFIRNTPLLVQLYFYYKGLPEIGIQISPINCGIIALSIYTGSYIAEVLRSGINSVASEQYQAARGLGMSKFQAFRLVIFPQALRIVIPSLGSQFINLVKNSSLVSFLAVTDVFYVIYKNAVDNFRFFEFFITGALIYMTMTGLIALITNLMERISTIPGTEATA
jgi:putative glutamine transport system permease protein